MNVIVVSILTKYPCLIRLSRIEISDITKKCSAAKIRKAEFFRIEWRAHTSSPIVEGVIEVSRAVSCTEHPMSKYQTKSKHSNKHFPL